MPCVGLLAGSKKLLLVPVVFMGAALLEVESSIRDAYPRQGSLSLLAQGSLRPRSERQYMRFQ